MVCQVADNWEDEADTLELEASGVSAELAGLLGTLAQQAISSHLAISGCFSTLRENLTMKGCDTIAITT